MYVDKETLHNELMAYLAQKAEAESKGQKPKPPSDYIGHAITNIANGLAQKHNFRNYTWIDEMIEDGILSAVKAIDKYDPTRGTQSGTPNPYGFFTQCIYWAFQNRITLEKEENQMKTDLMYDTLTDFYIDSGETTTISREHILTMLDDREI